MAQQVKVSLNWDDGVTNQAFIDGSVHKAHLLIENPTSSTKKYHVYLGSYAWASDGPVGAPFWFMVWDPLPTPHYPLVIEPGNSILWENDITMRSTYGQDYGYKDVGVQVLEGDAPELYTLIQWGVLDTINLVSGYPEGTIILGSSPFMFQYTGATSNLPEALTNIGPGELNIVTIIWDITNTFSYSVQYGAGGLKELVHGSPYIMIHNGTSGTTWNLLTGGNGDSEFKDLYAVYA